jgi:signal transduction histidine kinase
MTLSKRILAATVVTVTSLGVVLFILWSAIQLSSFSRLEEQNTLQNLKRAQNSLDADLAALDSKLADWTNWDDTGTFIETKDPQFIADNVTAIAMDGLNIDLMLFADTSGRIVYALGYDYHDAREASVSAAWPALLAGNRRLLDYPDLGHGISGLVVLPEGPMLMAARPVLTSMGEGPAQGMMVMGRYLSSDRVQELSATTDLSLSIYRLDDPQLPSELQAVRPALSTATPAAVRPLSRSSVAGYTLVSDIDGRPRLILRIDEPRGIYQQGESGLLTFLGALLVIGLTLGGVMLLTMRKLVLQPLAQLRDGVEHVAGGELGYRIPVAQHDEIGQLAAAFNDMAMRLDEREQQLRAYSAKLEQSNGELQEFAYVSSHDLQEPLRKIQAFGDRLRDKYGEVLDDQGRDYVSRMQSAAARMQSLIDGLLTYSRVTTKAQPFVPTDLRQITEEVLSDLETRIAQEQATVALHDLPTIDADPLQMRQLLQNLVANAMKFHKDGVAPVVEISGERLNGHSPATGDSACAVELCQIQVEDNGIGFDEKYNDRIFQVFQRLHGRGQYEGAGIGLSVCRKIAERHGGSITAHSTPGQGSTFIVTLPITHTEREIN